MEKKRCSVAYLLWLACGPFGAHRFYLGQPGWGLFYVLTFGAFLLGWLIDFFMIPAYVHAYNHRIDARRSGVLTELGEPSEGPGFTGGAGV